MQKKRYSSKTKSAQVYLEDLISKFISADCNQLPSVRYMAVHAKVSVTTMLKAITIVQNKGLITSEERKGVVIKRASAQDENKKESENPPQPRWQSVTDELRTSILDGTFKRGSQLPSLKELSAQLRTSNHTLCKAFSSLVEEGLIFRSKKGFAVFQKQSPFSQATLIVIGRMRYREVLCNMTPHSQEFWYNLDLKSQNTNIKFAIHSCSEVLGKEIWSTKDVSGLVEQCNHDTIIGILILPLGFTDEELTQVLQVTQQTNKPTVMVDEINSSSVGAIIESSGYVRRFLMSAGMQSGIKIGQHLLKMGHSHIAYLTYQNHDPVSQDRFNGIRQVFSKSGKRADLFYIPSCKTNGDLLQTALQSGEEQYLAKAYMDFICKQPHQHQSSEYHFYERILKPYEIDRQARHALKENLKTIIDKKYTAIVAKNDTTALIAFEYMRENTITVPQKIAICGFDDSHIALSCGLTSYNFNVPAIIEAMFDYIFSESRTKETESTTIEIPGFVQVRASTDLLLKQ